MTTNGTRIGLDYPEGWFQVAYSTEVADSQVVPLRYFGQELVLFRTQSGAAQVLDAYCNRRASWLRWHR